MLNIVLVNYNGAQDTINCINSIIDSNLDIECSVLVFDNNSTANDIELLRNYNFDIKTSKINEILIEYSPQNLGFAAGNNYWLRKIPDNDFIWFLNNDTLVNRNLFTRIRENLPEDDEVCYFDCYDFNNVFHDSGVHYINLITGKYSVNKRSNFDFEYVCGASILLKKTKKTPFWNEDYFLYFEDTDYSVKLKEEGYSFKHINNCFFMHKISASTSKSKKINEIKISSQIKFMRLYSKNFKIFYFIKKIYLLFVKRNFEEYKIFVKLGTIN